MKEEFTFELPERIDKMSHEATIISSTIALHTYPIDGKRDKRFKSGWRVFPLQWGSAPMITFLIEPTAHYQKEQIWRVGENGCLGNNAIVKGDDVYQLIPVSVDNNRGLANFNIPTKLPMLYMGCRFYEN